LTNFNFEQNSVNVTAEGNSILELALTLTANSIFHLPGNIRDGTAAVPMEVKVGGMKLGWEPQSETR
jgi:hypothetical protein